MLHLLSLVVAGKLFWLAAAFCVVLAGQAPSLQTTFDDTGLATLSYNGVLLIDVKAQRGDAFSVGSYQFGNRGGYAAAEKKSTWNATTKTITWTLAWGTIECQFATAKASQLDLRISVHNTGKEALTGINIYPLGLQFPDLPQGFGASNYPQFHNKLDGPDLIAADFSGGLVAFLETRRGQSLSTADRDHQ